MPSRPDTATVAIGLAVLSVTIVLYGLVILQQILLSVLVVGVVWFVFVFYLLFSVLTRIADALERMAEQNAHGPASDEFTRD